MFIFGFVFVFFVFFIFYFLCFLHYYFLLFIPAIISSLILHNAMQHAMQHALDLRNDERYDLNLTLINVKVLQENVKVNKMVLTPFSLFYSRFLSFSLFHFLFWLRGSTHDFVFFVWDCPVLVSILNVFVFGWISTVFSIIFISSILIIENGYFCSHLFNYD